MDEHGGGPSRPGERSSAIKDILSGTVGGVAQVIVGHPLDTVKVRMQAVGNQQGLATVFLQGLRAGNLYAGAASPLMGAMAHNAVLFFTIGQTKKFLNTVHPNEHRPIEDAFIGGALVGVTATLLETPVDLLKCKLQASNEFPGVIAAARVLYSRFGIAGLWQGMPATLMRNVPCFSMYFGFNAWGKETFRQRDGSISKFHQFLAGAAAGFGFWGFLYPLDVIKSRMQIQASEPSKRQYSSTLNCIQTLYKQEGSRVFWKGYSPAIIRALVVNGSVFLAFEVSKEWLLKRS